MAHNHNNNNNNNNNFVADNGSAITMASDNASVAPTRVASDHHPDMDVDNLPEGMIAGEKGRPAHDSTGEACMDFFFSVTPDVSAERFEELMVAAWQEDAGTALK